MKVSYWIHDKECCDPLATSCMDIAMGNVDVSVLCLSFLVYTQLTWGHFQFL